ncbi:glycosyl hydrolase [Alloscardovia macacae]|uniref:Exo-alpha-(1->6)-L-arabinopyranosidase n=1 Tax=Alloscardovia macacae TaxID=1160091 RepID=A0A1Y2SYD9_9BIFI|nr:glycoside hydrolase family 3 C-terminal domain-containing protein [Alloscardovia macacae]OTA26864.1 glycosyl hydrolase [Alloscardovia macacae]OTA29203.1 glycosyl hydrolase [Alloscardovia macacae]
MTLLERASLLSGQSEWESRALPQHDVPAFVMSDGPNGVRRQTGAGDHLGLGESKPATCFPTAGTVANSWDPDAARVVGQALGEEARDLGVQVLLGPGINMKRNPLCGRNFEYYSEDPLVAGRLAAGFIEGIQSNGVGACPKHFAVNSQELRRQASNSIVDERTLREYYLNAFEIAVKEAKPWTIMSSYNMVNGTYAHESDHLIKDILKGEWGFDGLVISDWGGSNDIVESARVGAALEMPAAGLASARQVVEGVRAGRLTEAELTASAQDVLNVVERTRGTHPTGDGFLTDAQKAEHHEIARQIAQKTAVLLQNTGSILPLSHHSRLVVVGDMAATARYQGSGSSKVNAYRVDHLLDALRASEDVEVLAYEQGYDRQGASRPDLVSAAVATVREQNPDVVVACIGLDERSESEGLDRSHMHIPQAQLDMLSAVAEAGKPVVVVLVAGSAVEVDFADSVDAILYIGLSGQAGALATVDVLTGAVNPSGHLAESWPVRYEDVPSAGNFPVEERDSVYREGPFVGYRYYSTQSIPVRYPFGYGLSYSTFEYSALSVDEKGVAFTVTNTSSVAGTDVAQLYVHPVHSGVLRPARELKGFTRVELEAGESKQVRIDFDEYTYRHFDLASNSWQVESGAWELFVGNSVENTPLSATHVVQGTMEPAAEKNDALGHYWTGDVRHVADAEFEALYAGTPHRTLETTPGVFVANDAISSWTSSRSWVARTIASTLIKQSDKALEKTGAPDLNTLFVLNMPPRAMAKMTAGAVSPQMVDGIVDIANKHFWRGTTHVITEYFRNAKDNKQTLKEISHE